MIARRFLSVAISLNFIHPLIKFTTNEIRSRTGSYITIEHCVLRSYSSLDLNETAREISRPSTSGNATFIAISLGLRPVGDASQVSFSLLDKISWKTGQSVFLNGPAFAGLSVEETAKAVVFSTVEISSFKVNSLINSSEC